MLVLQHITGYCFGVATTLNENSEGTPEWCAALGGQRAL